MEVMISVLIVEPSSGIARLNEPADTNWLPTYNGAPYIV